VTAADLGLDLVNISFGGYLDRSDPEQDLIYRQYVDAVRYARSKGTAIVAAAGNESTRIGARGLVLSHGTPTTPGDELFDPVGQYETPGRIPGVVDVSSTGNVVVPSSASCPPGTTGDPGPPPNFNATCKPASDPHQAAGPGRRNQLAYYSNAAGDEGPAARPAPPPPTPPRGAATYPRCAPSPHPATARDPGAAPIHDRPSSRPGSGPSGPA
jgi:Subtilase family